MALKTDLRHFLDDKGQVVELTDQAKTIFNFITKIVTSVSKSIKKPLINVDLKCSARGNDLHCEGSIAAKSITMGIIDWHCDTCEACGTISNWQDSMWDIQERTIH